MADPILLFFGLVFFLVTGLFLIWIIWIGYLLWQRRRKVIAPQAAKPAPAEAAPPPPLDRKWTFTEFDFAGLSHDLTQAVWAAAVLHAFDAEVLLALAPNLKDRVKTVYAEVQNLSFVEAAPDRRYCVHGPIRDSILAHLWRHKPDLYRAYSTRAAKYYSRVLSGKRGALGKLGEWCYRFVLPVSRQPAAQIEWLYHLALADPERAVMALRHLADSWTADAHYQDVDRLLLTLAEHLDAGRATDHLAATVHYFKAQAERRARRLQEALADLETARRRAGADLTLLDESLAAIGEVVDELNRSQAVPRHESNTWAAYRVWVDRIGAARHAQGGWRDVSSQNDRRNAALKHHQEMLEVYRNRKSRNLLGEAHTARAMADEYLLLDRPAEALHWYNAALRLYRRADSHFDEAATQQALGDLYQLLGRYAEALTYYAGAWAKYRLLNAPLAEASVLKARGNVELALAHFRRALDQYDEALSIYSEQGAELSEAAVLAAMGHALVVMGSAAPAQARYESALKIYVGHHDRLGEADTRLALGDQLRLTGQADAASNEYHFALEIYQASRDRMGEANVLLVLGKMAGGQDRGDEAVQQVTAALELYRAAGARLGEAKALAALGDEYQRRRQTAAAQAQSNAAIRHYAAAGQRRGEAEMHLALGLKLELAGQPAEAAVQFDLAAECYGQLGYFPGQAEVWLARGEQNLAGGDWEAAEQYLAAALILYEQVVDYAHQVQVLAVLADAQLALDQRPAAVTAYTKAIDLSAQLLPPQREAHGLRGLKDLAEGKFQSALTHFEAIAGLEDRVMWQVDAGLARFALGQEAAARDTLTRAWARADVHERAEARRWLARVQRLKPELVLPPDELGLRD
jgi:tetratricopeptide (TPR) repeat protein